MRALCRTRGSTPSSSSRGQLQTLAAALDKDAGAANSLADANRMHSLASILKKNAH